MGLRLDEILSPSYLSRFGIETAVPTNEPIYQNDRLQLRPPIRPQIQSYRSTPDRDYTKHMIRLESPNIAGQMLKGFASALRETASQLLAATPKGGARPNLVRDFVLLNLVALWDDVFAGNRGVYFDESDRHMSGFIESACRILGAPFFSTEHFIKQAIRSYNRRSGRNEKKPARK